MKLVGWGDWVSLLKSKGHLPPVRVVLPRKHSQMEVCVQVGVLLGHETTHEKEQSQQDWPEGGELSCSSSLSGA